MSTVDVRHDSGNEIRFADKNGYDYYPDIIKNDGSRVSIVETDTGRELAIRDRQHLDNLRKALNKVEELGWLK